MPVLGGDIKCLQPALPVLDGDLWVFRVHRPAGGREAQGVGGCEKRPAVDNFGKTKLKELNFEVRARFGVVVVLSGAEEAPLSFVEEGKEPPPVCVAIIDVTEKLPIAREFEVELDEPHDNNFDIQFDTSNFIYTDPALPHSETLCVVSHFDVAANCAV